MVWYGTTKGSAPGTQRQDSESEKGKATLPKNKIREQYYIWCWAVKILSQGNESGQNLSDDAFWWTKNSLTFISDIMGELTRDNQRILKRGPKNRKEERRGQLKSRLKYKQKQKLAVFIWNSISYYCRKKCDKKERLYCQWSRTNFARPKTVKSRVLEEV